MNNTKLWPVDQLLQWLSKIESKFLRIKSNDLSTLIAILKYINNETLEGWPSVETISKITLKSHKRVRDVIKRLNKLEIIITTERYTQEGDRDSNMYKYNPEKLWRVGAICTLPSGTFVSHRRVHLYPLTTNRNTYLTKKRASRSANAQDQKPHTSYVDVNTMSEEAKKPYKMKPRNPKDDEEWQKQRKKLKS